MYYVYVLYSKERERKFYIGFTRDVEQRLLSHNAGRNRSTKGSRWELVYYEAYASKQDARCRERSLKKHGQSLRALKERIDGSLLSTELK